MTRQMVEVFSCDRCEGEFSDSVSFGIDVERYCDASGNTSTRTLSFDLCPDCRTTILGKLFRECVRKPDAIAKIKKMIPQAQLLG